MAELRRQKSESSHGKALSRKKSSENNGSGGQKERRRSSLSVSACSEGPNTESSKLLKSKLQYTSSRTVSTKTTEPAPGNSSPKCKEKRKSESSKPDPAKGSEKVDTPSNKKDTKKSIRESDNIANKNLKEESANKPRRKSITKKDTSGDESKNNIEKSLPESRRKSIKKSEKDSKLSEEQLVTPPSKPRNKSIKKATNAEGEPRGGDKTKDLKNSKTKSEKKIDGNHKDSKTAKPKRQTSTGNKSGKIEEDSRIVNHLYDDNIFDSCKMFFRKKMGKN